MATATGRQHPMGRRAQIGAHARAAICALAAAASVGAGRAARLRSGGRRSEAFCRACSRGFTCRSNAGTGTEPMRA